MKFKATDRRIVTLTVSLVLLVVFMVVGASVHVPYVSEGPGPTVNTLGEYGGHEVVRIEGAPVDPTSGHLNLTTVSVTDDLTLFQALGKWFSGSNSLEPRELVYPPDQTREENDQQNKQQMAGSEQSAVIAALRYLNRPVAPYVAAVQHPGPSDGKLRVDDELRTVDGQPVADSAALRAAVSGRPVGSTVTIGVRRAGADLNETITLAANPADKKKAMLGIAVEDRSADPNLKVDISVGDIGGPSAGLMMTLAIIDKLSPGELTGGKFIAGTGTIDPDGGVGPIGGITHKMRAARDAGATNFLVPADNCAEAKSDKPAGLTLLKVHNLGDAITGLGDITSGKPAPSC